MLEVTLPVTIIDSTTLSFAALVALAVAGAILKIVYSGKRGKEMMESARRLGLTIEGNDWKSSARVPQLESPLFGKGTEREFENIVSGMHDGLTTNFFDYTYRTGRTGITQTVAAFTQDVLLPTFEAAPTGIAGRVAFEGAPRAIQFEFNPEFSKRFRLLGPDEDRIRKLFTRRVVHFLMETQKESRWHFEGSDFTLILYRHAVTIKPPEFPEFVKETTEMAKVFLGLGHY